MRIGRAIAIVSALLVGAGAGSAGLAGATTPPTTEPASPTEVTVADSEWTAIDAPEDCMCADGAPYNFFERQADPARVVFFLEGGGACFTPESCAFTDEPTTLYDWNIGADDCRFVIDALVDEGFLKWTSKRTVIRTGRALSMQKAGAA